MIAISRVFFFNITYACNNRCKDCVSHHTRKHSQRLISVEDLVKIDRQFHFSGNDRIVISGGEPLLSPNFVDIIRWLYQYTHHIVLYTNGRRLLDTSFAGAMTERIIVPLYGSELSHIDYTGNAESFKETIVSLKKISVQYPHVLDLKLVVRGSKSVLEFLHDFEVQEILSLVTCVSVCGFIESLTSKVTFDSQAYSDIEKFVLQLLDNKIKVKIYDIPLCGFSQKFLERIIGNFDSRYSFKIGSKICCSIQGNYKEVGYDRIPNYNSRCKFCELNNICSMVLRRYNVLALEKDVSYMDTE